MRHDGPLIVGAGLAGLSAALEAARAGAKVLVITPEPLLNACSSAWAQGGMAAALTAVDSPERHALDTEAAGAGLVEAEAARALTGVGRQTVEWLAALGAPFDREADGGFVVSLEAAHSTPRVARVGGDGAGRAILSAVVAAVRAEKRIEVWDDGRLKALTQDADGRVVGAVIARGPNGRLVEITATAVVLATGGAGGLFAATTTPSALKGEGMALAALAGAEILDPEFVQFHPTAIDVGLDPAPLATEALRGEGARLIDGEGRFLLGQADDADLKPRDIVARAVHAARRDGRGADLDARAAIGAEFPHAFPAVFAACMRAGLDPRLSPIPVMAACHYHMGGIAADAGRSHDDVWPLRRGGMRRDGGARRQSPGVQLPAGSRRLRASGGPGGRRRDGRGTAAAGPGRARSAPRRPGRTAGRDDGPCRRGADGRGTGDVDRPDRQA